MPQRDRNLQGCGCFPDGSDDLVLTLERTAFDIPFMKGSGAFFVGMGSLGVQEIALNIPCNDVKLLSHHPASYSLEPHDPLKP